MQLLIIRHGDPDYPNNTITKTGHLEAQALAARMKHEGLDRIYCSPMGRAIDTMKYTSDLLGIEPVIEHWTEEIHIDVELDKWGKVHICDVPGEVVRHPDYDTSHYEWQKRNPYNSPQFLDKIEQIRLNSDEFIKRHGYEREGERFRCVNPNREKIAVFCHAAMGMVWISYLLGIPLPLMWSGFWLAPSSVTTIILEERSSDWAVPRCIGLGDISHLYASGYPISRRGLYANL